MGFFDRFRRKESGSPSAPATDTAGDGAANRPPGEGAERRYDSVKIVSLHACEIDQVFALVSRLAADP